MKTTKKCPNKIIMDENMPSESVRISNKVYNLLCSCNSVKNEQNGVDEKFIMGMSRNALYETESELNKGLISPCRAASNVRIIIEHMQIGRAHV